MRQDDRGMTLIELVIAVAISVIIMGAATYFIRSALKSYEAASDTIDLQMESQILMEQISTWVMEGNRIKVVDGTNLVIYKIPRKVDATKLPSGVTLPNQESSKIIIGMLDGKLYRKEVGHIVDPDSDIDVGITSADAVVENCIGEYVTEFSPVIDVTNQSKVTVLLKLEAGTQEYQLKNVMKIRND